MTKYEKVMREYAKGRLRHGGSGKIVKRPDVAKAIAASEASRYRKNRYTDLIKRN